MEMIKRTGIIKVSQEGMAQEIVMRYQGLRLQKVESAEIPLRYKRNHYVNIYKNLKSIVKK
jgi:hypothetical protein